MRDEKEGRKKEASKVKQQQGKATQHTQHVHVQGSNVQVDIRNTKNCGANNYYYIHLLIIVTIL